MKTPSPFIEKFPDVEGEGSKAAKPDHIYLDAMGFGMGMSCLQVLLKIREKIIYEAKILLSTWHHVSKQNKF